MSLTSQQHIKILVPYKCYKNMTGCIPSILNKKEEQEVKKVYFATDNKQYTVDCKNWVFFKYEQCYWDCRHFEISLSKNNQ